MSDSAENSTISNRTPYRIAIKSTTGAEEKLVLPAFGERKLSAEEIDSYEMVSSYHVNPEDQEKLLLTQKECVFNSCTSSTGVPLQLVYLFNRCTRDQWPIGVIMSYIWRRDRIWLTRGVHHHRMAAIFVARRSRHEYRYQLWSR